MNERASIAGSGDWPEYCCAILRDQDGRYVLERRAEDAKHAPGMLTCFGGRREDGESPEACVRRELREELGREVGEVALRVRLRSRGVDGNVREIAWFFEAVGAIDANRLLPSPGIGVVVVRAEELSAALLSPWHRAAIHAAERGEAEAWVEGASSPRSGGRDSRD